MRAMRIAAVLRPFRDGFERFAFILLCFATQFHKTRFVTVLQCFIAVFCGV